MHETLRTRTTRSYRVRSQHAKGHWRADVHWPHAWTRVCFDERARKVREVDGARMLGPDAFELLAADAKIAIEEIAPGAADVLTCPVDERPCEVAMPIAAQLPTALALSLLDAFSTELPCDECRACAKAAGELRGQRLGQREREVLVGAAAPNASEGAVVVAENATRAEAEATLRALRVLHRRGLVVYGRNRRRRRTAWRTPLGEEIAWQYKRELEEHRRVRWDMRVVSAATVARRPVHELVQRFGERVRTSCATADVGELLEAVEKAVETEMAKMATPVSADVGERARV